MFALPDLLQQDVEQLRLIGRRNFILGADGKAFDQRFDQLGRRPGPAMGRQAPAGVGVHIQERPARIAEPARPVLHAGRNPAQAARQHRPDLGARLHHHQPLVNEHEHALVMDMRGYGDAFGFAAPPHAERGQQYVGHRRRNGHVKHGWQV
ncbi:hypothetical protein D3C86_1368190 [compost metagenome]